MSIPLLFEEVRFGLVMTRTISPDSDQVEAGMKVGNPSRHNQGKLKWHMITRVERISAVTFRVTNMKASVRFYRDTLGMGLIYGGEDSYFSSLRAKDADSAILNLEQGDPGKEWGRLILYVADVDAFWAHLKEKGYDPAKPQDGAWGERYFHMLDPDGHGLSFAHPLP